MARTVTRLQLRTWVRSKGDWPDTNFVTDTEINEELNAGIAYLHRLIANARGYEYFRTSTNLATVAGTDTVALPADFYDVLALWWDQGSGIKVPIRRYMPVEGEDQITGEGWTGSLASDNVRYSLVKDAFRFVPTPAAIHTVKCEYIQAPLVFSADTGAGGTWDGYGGFEEFPVWYAVATFLQKEESDASVALARMADVRQSILATAARDHAEPIRAQDVRGWPVGRRMMPSRWR